MSLHLPYKAYKPAHIAWLNEVPAHWSVSSLRWLSTRYTGGTPDRENPDFWKDGSIPWLNSGAVNDPLIQEPSAHISEAGFAGSSAKWIPKGALVMALAGQGKTKGTVAQLGFSATCNQSMAALIPTKRVDARYLFWWLQTNYTNIRSMSGGDLRDGLNLQLLGDVAVPLPSQDEQRTIVSFLDRETAQIDELIGKQERLIKLLAEKRQAIITHAVTKGLDPTAPIKPSGIPWLGDIPAHWHASKIRYVADTIIGLTYAPEDVSDAGTLVLRSGNVQKGHLVHNDDLFVSKPVNPKLILEKGDIVMCARNGSAALVGKNAVVSDEFVGTAFGAFMTAIRSDLNPWLQWIFASSLFSFQLGSFSTSTINQLTNATLNDFDVPMPPRNEMLKLCDYLEEACAKIDKLQKMAEGIVALLRERRSALISAAVTGKIDVREGTA